MLVRQRAGRSGVQSTHHRQENDMGSYQQDRRVTVVIDPGHGGQTHAGLSSARGVRGPGGTLEKDVNLELAHRVAAQLGPEAVLTRRGDENLSLADRAAVAQRYGARVFLSLHANEGHAGARGPELFVHPRAPGQSRSFAAALQRELGSFGGGGGGTRSAELAVLSPDRLSPQTAACLLEVDYLSSPDGEQRLRDPRSLDALGSSIARGVRGFLGGGSLSPVAQPRLRQRFPLGQAQGEQSEESAKQDPSKSYFEIVEDNTGVVPPDAPLASTAGYDRGLDGAGGTIVNLASFAWKVMEDNQPTTSITTDNANAVPAGATLTDLAGWYPTPRTLKLHYHTESTLLSSDVYLTIRWYFNGSYKGVGQYINAATVEATGDVAFGQHIDISASISNPMNLGTMSVPVGALPIKISLNQHNLFQSWSTVWDGVLQGNGAGKIAEV
jgi:N-acetylmuramoyl-L-alanine amidase